MSAREGAIEGLQVSSLVKTVLRVKGGGWRSYLP